MKTARSIDLPPNVKIGGKCPEWDRPIRESLITTKSGHLTVKVKRADGREAFLHSRFDPFEEARNQISDLEIGMLDTIIVDFSSFSGFIRFPCLSLS